jgi:probable rRNA maturation factor
MGEDAPTDVLSFPFGDLPSAARIREAASQPGQPTYLGDIAISFPRAKEQAAAAGHSVEAELRLLVVHGVLHLLGHDHAGPADRARMWQAQEEILKGFNQ